MPKSQMICPVEARKSTSIKFEPIPVNQYNKTVSEELIRYSKEDLLRIQRDMEIIRAFENMLNEIKLRGNYKGIEYNHRGPAHLSIGQEAGGGRAGVSCWASMTTSTAATAATARSWPRASRPSRSSMTRR